MRLKRVRIFGFKTFADKTEFSLDGGIVAVVGPNGCGKSNLVDAILWGLGEGNSRHLRAQTSQDVIFGGSARRKAVGFAEVTLYFDNEDGALPVDTPEVTITRRLTRAGDSEYFINRRSCRQRDIHDLLADSGLGRAGYSIVSQKEIDQALAASPEDRRAWVDEAAGVQRYRARRAESIKRLASAKEHLVRVDDIVRELDAQREPLREEAEVAKRYKAAVGALREVETGLLIQDLAKATRELAELETRLSSSGDLARRESERAESLDEEVRVLRARVADVEHHMEGLRGQFQDSISRIERADSSVRLAEERLRSLDDLESTLLSQSGAEVIADAEIELTTCRSDEEDASAALDQARHDVGGVGAEAQALQANLKAAEQELAEARRQAAARLKQVAENEHRQDRRVGALRELEGLEQDLPKLTRARDEAAEHLEQVLESERIAAQLASGLKEKTKADEAEQDRLAAAIRERLAERAALDGRRRGIEATISAHEGLAQGPRAVLDAAAAGVLSAEYTPVGEAVQTEKTTALAIETALGAAANDLIVEHERDAKAAIQYLKEKRLGRATFQPIPLMRNSDPSSELRRLANAPGVLGRASELVTCDPTFRPVIDSLLGRVLVVESLDASLRIAKTGGWSRIVTLDGEVVHSSGAVTGGTASKQHYGLVQRKSDLAEVEKQLGKLDRALAKDEAERTAREAAREALVHSLAAARAALEERASEVREAKLFLQTLGSELQAAERSRDKLAAELQRLAQTAEVLPEPEVDRLQVQRDALMQELASRSADANQAKERLQNAELRLQQARSRMQSAAKRLELAKQSESSRTSRLEALGPERAKLKIEIGRYAEDKDGEEGRRKRFEAELRDAQRSKDGLLEASIAKTEEAKTARENLAAMASANHQAELARARADARRASAEERLLEEYGIGAEDALSQAEGIIVPPDAQPLAQRLRREIRAMGPVNVGAIEAYDRLATRHEELTNQREDILEGIGQVQESMQALDKLTRDKFLDTFAKVQSAYSEMFLKLFGGGEGKISLDNPGNILESGIEIEVTLPGKKRQRLELLSGGERALCASGFLFALLHTKPSPLVVLDEVDAPLDGRNVERFADLLVEFTSNTQFIVITHNPTTIERAPVWLGVTMQEPGVSTLVPARMPAPSPAPQADPQSLPSLVPSLA